MMDAREFPEAIQWHEGMLLGPHHFQQASLRSEGLLHYHALTIDPFHWGVRRFKVDAALLVGGTFRLLELEAVMPDGLIVSHYAYQDEELSVDLTPHVNELKVKPATIQVAVPAKKRDAGSVKGTLARYQSMEGQPVFDENTGENELRIPRLRPRVSLLIGDTQPQKYASFPLARVAYKNEAFGLTDFIAPPLQVPLRSPIGDLCAGIAARLREKAAFLADRVGKPTMSAGPLPDLETRMVIHNLVAALPQFEAVLNTGVAHPYVLYLALCSVVGHVAALGRSLVPPPLSAYNHGDVRSSFEQARDYVFRVLDEGIRESHTAIPFNSEDSTFSLHFDAAWMQAGLVLGARTRQGLTEKDVIAWVEGATVGSRAKQPALQERRVFGAARRRIDKDGDLVPLRNEVLFSLTADPLFIEPDQILEVFNESALRPADLVLYVRNKA